MRADSWCGDGCVDLRSGRRVILVAPDLLDGAAATAAAGHVLSAVRAGARLLIVDMSATVICDYAAAGAMLRACTRAEDEGLEVRVVAVSPMAGRMLEAGALRDLVSVFSSVADAISGPAPAPMPAARDQAAGPGMTGDDRQGVAS